MAEFKKDENEIGSLWKNESGGKVYYSGTLKMESGEMKVVMFHNNKYVEGGKIPYYVIKKSVPIGARKQQQQEEVKDDLPF